MGFTPPRTVYRLDFEGTDLDGLEVRMYGGNLGQAFDFAGLVGVTERTATAEDVRLLLQQYAEIAGHLKSWNIDDARGEPVPADLEGKTLELKHVQAIAEAWQRAQVDVPGPLPSNSPDGPPDLLEIPMAAIPASLAS